MSIARSLARSIASPLARSLAGGTGAGGGGPAPLNILAHVGTSTSPTSTGTKAVTGVGFVPKLVMPFASNGLEGAGTHAMFGLGACSASSQASVLVDSRTGQTTSATNRRHTNTATLENSFNSAVQLSAAYSSFDSNGFTLQWNTVNAQERVLNHLCLGGDDLEVSLTQHQMNNTNAAQSFAHGLSGVPTGLLAFSVNRNVVPPNTVGGLSMLIGAWADTSQWLANINSRSGVTTTAAGRQLDNSCFMGTDTGTFATLNRKLEVASVDGSHVNGNYTLASGTNEAYFWLLAIRGAKCQTGTFDCNGSTSPLTISTTGITPKAVIFVFVDGAVDSINTVLNDIEFAIGVSDGVNNVSCGITDGNGVTTTNARRYQSSNSLVTYRASDGAKVFEATAAFSGQSVILTPTVNAGSFRGQGFYMVIGS